MVMNVDCDESKEVNMTKLNMQSFMVNDLLLTKQGYSIFSAVSEDRSSSN